MAFFIASAFSCALPDSSASLISEALAARSKCTSIEHPRSTTALTVAMVANPARPSWAWGRVKSNGTAKRSFSFFDGTGANSHKGTVVKLTDLPVMGKQSKRQNHVFSGPI